jgi:hypothetical protein
MVLPNARRCFRVGHRRLERSLRDAHGLRGDADPAAVQQLQRDLQALAFFAQAISFRDFAIGEGDFRRARSAQSHLILVTRHSKTGK